MAALRQLVTTGKLVPVRRGAYVPSEMLAGLDGRQVERTLTLARVAAVGRRLGPEVVMSHLSAAALWGLPLVGDDSTVVHVIPPSHPSERSARDIARHGHRIAAGHVTTHRGFSTTTLERTVVDCAMALPLAQGLIIADAALHIGADLGECWRILEPMAGHRGVRSARAVLTYADAGAESSGETLLRLALLRGGFPVPTTQVMIVTRRGTYWTDVGWPRLRVVGEYDGESKYLARDDAVGAIVDEKRRQAAIEGEGYAMFRALKSDLSSPEALESRVRRLARFGPIIERPELFPTPPSPPLR